MENPGDKMAMKHIKIRDYLAKVLKDGNKNSRELLDMINEHFRHGTNSQILGNLLAKDPRFTKIGAEKTASIVSGHYDVAIWGLAE